MLSSKQDIMIASDHVEVGKLKQVENAHDEDAPFIWQGANSNLPHPKKHTDNVTVSQLKPWMRVTIPVKVISLGTPAQLSRGVSQR